MEPFNNEKYIKLQSEKILERINASQNKLYLEFGGKLTDDYHASRVLPGFKFDNKIKLLQALKSNLEIILCISAPDIESNKIRGDYRITYESDALRLLDTFKSLNIKICGVVINRYQGGLSSDKFKEKLEHYGIKTYLHPYIKGYPSDIDLLLSDSGYGANEYIETTMPLVVVTAPGSSSGKLATCMSQLYHEHKRGNKAQYAKFETFPVWNLPLKSPVNVAYEAATADIADVNMIDPFHLEAYNKIAVNYNRDIELFPVIKNILHKISQKDVYNSPTDMGVNMVGFCIEDEIAVSKAAEQEVIRRYYRYMSEAKKGLVSLKTVDKLKLLMNELNLSPSMRTVVEPAILKSKKSNSPAVAIKLHDGTIITGRKTNLLTPGASVILNSLKHLTNINDEILLISENIFKPIQNLKIKLENDTDSLLNINDVLLALSVCAVTNPMADMALSKISELQECEAHSTHIFSNIEEKTYSSLKIRLTTEPNFNSDKIFNE